MKAILCIDDTPIRYRMFYKEAAKRGIMLIISEHPEVISQVLRYPVEGVEILGVCLDYQMRGVKVEDVIPEIQKTNLPVAIVTNDRSGAWEIQDLLGPAHRSALLPAEIGDLHWVLDVLTWLEST